MAKRLVKFEGQVNTLGTLEGLFLADSADIDALNNSTVNFDSVEHVITQEQYQIYDLPVDIIELLTDTLTDTLSGYNLVQMKQEQEEASQQQVS